MTEDGRRMADDGRRMAEDGCKICDLGFGISEIFVTMMAGCVRYLGFGVLELFPIVSFKACIVAGAFSITS